MKFRRLSTVSPLDKTTFKAFNSVPRSNKITYLKRQNILPLAVETTKVSKRATFARTAVSPQPVLKRKINDSSKRINIEQIENMLLGKVGTEAIDIHQYGSFNFGSSTDITKENNSNRLWKKMVNYTTGNQNDGRINSYILANEVRKEVSKLLADISTGRDLFLDNFNMFKAFVFQKLVFPRLRPNKQSVLGDKRLHVLIDLLSNHDFYGKVKESFKKNECNKIKQDDEISGLESHNLSMPNSLQYLSFKSPQNASYKFSHIKSKVKPVIGDKKSKTRFRSKRTSMIPSTKKQILNFLKEKTMMTKLRRESSVSSVSSDSVSDSPGKSRRKFKNFIILPDRISIPRDELLPKHNFSTQNKIRDKSVSSKGSSGDVGPNKNNQFKSLGNEIAMNKSW